MNWIARHRPLGLALICAFWTAFVLLTLIFPEVPFFSAVSHGEQSFSDLLRRDGRKTPTRSDFVLLGIDEATRQFVPFNSDDLKDNRAMQLLTERPPPWSRELWALLLDRLFAAGARLVMFDMIFGKPGEGDEAFHNALERYRDKVVLGVNFDFATLAGDGATRNQMTAVWPSETLIPNAKQDDRAGYVVFFPDSLDGSIRSVRYFISDRQLADRAPHPSQQVFASLSARAVEKLGQGNRLPRELVPRQLRFGANGAYPPKSLAEIFDPAVWRANYGGGAFFKDKVVMIGATSQVEHDFVNTPMSPNMLGPELHLHAIAAALSGEFLRPTPLPLRILLVGAGGALAWVLIAFIRRPSVSVISITLVTVGYLALARVLYDQTGLLLLTVPVLTTFVLSGAFSLGFEYILERREKLKTRRTLERYVSKNLVKEILDNPSGYYNTLKGARMPVTVVFSDLIGFTNLSERAEPEELVSHLNELLSGMVRVVFENNGTLDKFIGDAIMAVWGNVRSTGVREDAEAAARAALGMREALKALNARWREEGRMPLGMGIGINSGEAIVGNIGSYAPHERLDPTVIGDAVNLASRLEALTRNYGVDILVGEAASELLRESFHLRSVALVQVKGKTIPVAVSTLLGPKNESVDSELLKSVASYEEGIAKFRGRDFGGSRAHFESFLERYPQDYLAKMYLDRAEEYEKEPPDAAWTGAEIFTKK